MPLITFDDIGGLDAQIQLVKETIELPLNHPELFKQYGLTLPRGLLLYGPPGTGKTLIAKAVAHSTNSYFVSIDSSQITSSLYGETEAKVTPFLIEAAEGFYRGAV